VADGLAGLDRTTILRGAGYALSWVVPCGIANAIAASKDAGGWVFLTFVLIIVGFAFGGYGTARDIEDQPLQHAAAAAVLAFLVAQAVFIVIRIARGEPVSIPGIILTALLAASAGVLGGLLAAKGARPGSRR